MNDRLLKRMILEAIQEVLADHPEALMNIRKLEKIVEKINNDYGMSDEDFDRQFSGY